MKTMFEQQLHMKQHVVREKSLPTTQIKIYLILIHSPVLLSGWSPGLQVHIENNFSNAILRRVTVSETLDKVKKVKIALVTFSIFFSHPAPHPF